jgi:hypothetical protein
LSVVVGAKREKMVEEEEDTPNDEDVAMDVN